ncbi:MAG: bifunctional UDP-N-acetylglucosamine diphosphorylase/glucosamine-1-phosphate N-acetyltransferase GlmU [Eubacteriaceae bacterium]|nr:bifunctional UDP-N-acetylglucosamine diphosphorylase/glucosamine-1-phosphate N-acetyltransferase GlmU [Eubacteriaceae bacterium]
MSKISAVVLAAGKGTRMRSDRPKVLFEVYGKAILSHVTDNIKDAGIENISLVVSPSSDEIREKYGDSFVYSVQETPLGTGHALLSAKEFMENMGGKVYVACGDAPLVDEGCIRQFISYAEEGEYDLCLLSADIFYKNSYGRIVRDENGDMLRIVETKDANEEERKITEVNSGTYLIDINKLLSCAGELQSNNSQKEYYLTDFVEIFRNHGYKVGAYKTEDSDVVLGVNTRIDLAKINKVMQRRINEELMLSGVSIIDPENTYIEKDVIIGKDTVIYPGTFISGKTVIGERNEIFSSRIISSVIGNDNVIESSTIEESSMGDHSKIGPYAHFRPKSSIGNGLKIGNFVELKNAHLADGVKASHHAYLGDVDIEEDVNIGCGVITANYDGENKHRSRIGRDSFIGCNSNIVSPVNVGERTFVAAGSNVTEDTPPGSFVIGRVRQETKVNKKHRYR